MLHLWKTLKCILVNQRYIGRYINNKYTSAYLFFILTNAYIYVCAFLLHFGLKSNVRHQMNFLLLDMHKINKVIDILRLNQ